jgi:hypothetical protein
MFLALMLVGYANSKLNANKAGAAPWRAWLFGPKKAAGNPAPSRDDTIWTLGAEAWVTIPAQAPIQTKER